jgi:threonine/homoserine/homoserine lactone efflux protein
VGREAWTGLLVGATNRKTAAFFAAVLPSFVDRVQGHVPLQILVLGLVWMVLALVGDSAWALAGARAGSWFSRSPRRASTATGASGLVTACLGEALAFTGKGR